VEERGLKCHVWRKTRSSGGDHKDNAVAVDAATVGGAVEVSFGVDDQVVRLSSVRAVAAAERVHNLLLAVGGDLVKDPSGVDATLGRGSIDIAAAS